jgi:glycosyltransferase involved in cell wall biosynthesis
VKSVVINESTKFTGLGRYAHDLSEALDAPLFSLNLDSAKDDRAYDGEVFKKSTIMKIGNGWYINHRFPSIFLTGIGKQIQHKIPRDAIIHYASQSIPRLDLKNRYLYTVHDLFGLNPMYNPDSRIRKLLQANMKNVLGAERVVTVSNHIKSEVETLTPSGEVIVIYPPVSRSFKRIEDKDSIRKFLGLPLDKKLVLSVSTEDPRKNFKTVLETVKKLGDGYKLVRVGRSIDGAYCFNRVDDVKLNLIYNACDVLLFPSLDEGFGYPIAEAMTVGLPVVASDIEVFREIAGDAATLFNPTPENLADGISFILKDPDYYGQAGIRRSTLFTLGMFRKNLHTLYNSL